MNIYYNWSKLNYQSMYHANVDSAVIQLQSKGYTYEGLLFAPAWIIMILMYVTVCLINVFPRTYKNFACNLTVSNPALAYHSISRILECDILLSKSVYDTAFVVISHGNKSSLPHIT